MEDELYDNIEMVAKFMGYQILNVKYETTRGYSAEEYGWVVTEGEIVCDSNGKEVDDENQEPYYRLAELPFNLHWDWLMPVITKIYKLGYIPVFYGNYCNITNKDLFTHKYDGEGFNVEYYSESEDKLIDAVWNCVVKFVKWHTSE